MIYLDLNYGIPVMVVSYSVFSILIQYKKYKSLVFFNYFKGNNAPFCALNYWLCDYTP